MEKDFLKYKRAFLITAVYCAIGLTWIYCSDFLAEQLSSNKAELLTIQEYKGFFYILATSILLYALVTYFLHKQSQESRITIRALQEKLNLEKELKQTQKSLIDNHLLLSTIVNSTPDAMFVKDIHGTYMLFNESAARFVGIDAKDVIGKTDFDIFPAEFAKIIHDKDSHVISTKATSSHEEILVNNQGVRFVFQATKGPIFDNQHNVIGIYGVSHDKTKQIDTEAELLQKAKELGETNNKLDASCEEAIRINEILMQKQDELERLNWSLAEQSNIVQEAEYRLQTIIDMEPECIIILDTNGYLQYMNPAGLDMLEATLAQVQGNDMLEFIMPEYRDAFIQMHNKVIAGEKKQMVFETVGLNGRHCWLETNSVPMQTKEGIILLGVARDISEHKKLMTALLESQKVAKIGHYDFDILNDSWTSSETLDALFGIDKSYDKTTAGWLNIVHQEDKEMMEQYLCGIIINKSDFDKKYRIQTLSNKKTAWVQGYGRLRYDTQGNPIAMFGVIMDITESKNIEDEIRQINAQLEVKVEQETTKRVQQEALLIQQAKMALMGEMIGAIAHQWRQPLNSLGLTIQDVSIAHTLGELNEEYLEKFQTDSMTTIKRMSKTIDDFRNYFKPNEQKEEFTIKEVIDATLHIIGPQLNAHGIAVNSNVANLHKISGYKNDFEHILLILISNAQDALLDNKIQEPVITINCYEDEKESRTILSIEDNGGGVPANVIDRIFEPYFTTKDQGKGTGIGLYMAQMMLERHMHSDIYVENTDGGAKFIIELKVS